MASTPTTVRAMARLRNLEDQEVSILVVEPGVSATPEEGGEASTPLVVRYTIDPDGQISASRPTHPGWSLDATAVLLDLPTQPEAILVVGPKLRRLERGSGGSDLIQRAAQGASAWQREHVRATRRLQLPDRLLAFTEELNRAQTVSAVCTVLMEHVGRLVGAYTALVFLFEEDERTPEGLRPAMHPWISHGLAGIRLSADLRFEGPGLVTATQLRGEGRDAYLGLDRVFAATGASAAAAIPLGDHGVMLVLERRSARSFEAEDWDLLRSIARLAEVSLERVRLFERVHELSLTDPLTGLGNRRKLEIVLEYSFAAARRGQRLSVVMIDLNGFKRFNDEQGHLKGDEMLRIFAGVLREQVRGSDLVVRYGGDEFLMVLSGSDAAQAALTVDRIRENMPEPLSFTAGIAEYDRAVTSPSELVRQADTALYDQRRPRG